MENAPLKKNKKRLRFVHDVPLKEQIEIQNQDLKVCHICDAKFTKMFSLKRHMKLHTMEKPFVCAVCSYSFIQKSDLQRHLATHSDKFPHVCKFANCNRRFRTKRNMQSHQTNVHLYRGFYRCPICHKRFKFMSTFKMHYRKEHTTDCDTFICDLCANRSFSSKNLLKKHLWRHLKSGKDFKPKDTTKLIEHFRRNQRSTCEDADSEEEIKVTIIEETELTPEDVKVTIFEETELTPEEVKLTIIEETEMTPEEILGDFDFTTASPDDFEVEMVTEVFDDVEIKSEIFIEKETWETPETVVKKRKRRTKIEVQEIRQANAAKELEECREFLQVCLPHMKTMNELEKKNFKLNVKKIVENALNS